MKSKSIVKAIKALFLCLPLVTVIDYFYRNAYIKWCLQPESCGHYLQRLLPRDAFISILTLSIFYSAWLFFRTFKPLGQAIFAVVGFIVFYVIFVLLALLY